MPDRLRRAWGSEGNDRDKLAGWFAVDHRMQVFALAAGASAETHPDRAIKALVDHVAPQVGVLAGVFGELKGAAVDGGGHDWLEG